VRPRAAASSPKLWLQALGPQKKEAIEDFFSTACKALPRCCQGGDASFVYTSIFLIFNNIKTKLIPERESFKNTGYV